MFYLYFYFVLNENTMENPNFYIFNKNLIFMHDEAKFASISSFFYRKTVYCSCDQSAELMKFHMLTL